MEIGKNSKMWADMHVSEHVKQPETCQYDDKTDISGAQIIET